MTLDQLDRLVTLCREARVGNMEETPTQIMIRIERMILEEKLSIVKREVYDLEQRIKFLE